jgi:hypothetical protein
MLDRSSQRPTGQRTTPALRRARARKREGAVAVTVVLMFGVILGMMALAIDAGHVYKVRTEAQNAADATALAGAAPINGTEAGITAARAAAVNFAANNRIYSGAAVVAEEDVLFGRWSPLTGVFTELEDDEVTSINAIRVRTTPADVDNPFAGVFGRNETPVAANAIAARGGPPAQCSFPMVVGDCELGIGNPSDERCFRMQNAGTDTAGWSNLGTDGGFGGGNIAALLYSGCTNLIPGCSGFGATATECAGACTSPLVDQEIGTNSGNFFNEGGVSYGGSCPTAGEGEDLRNPCQVIKQILLRNTNPDASEELDDFVNVELDGAMTPVLKGTYFTVKVPMIPATDSEGVCSADFNASGEPVSGFVSVDIYGIKCSNPNPAVVDDEYLAAHETALDDLGCVPPSGDFLLGRMYVEEEDGRGGGGPAGNSSALPRLVQ